MKWFTHRGIPLEYEDEGSGIPFLFLHGMGGSDKQIRSVCGPVPGVRRIILNQQGHGRSGADWDSYSFDRLGDDAAALLDHLDIDRAVLGGISMGAAVSLNTAIRYPGRVRALLLIRNAWTDKPMSEEVQTAYADLGRCLKEGGAEAFKQTEGWKIVDGPSDYTRNAFLQPFDDPASVRNWQKYLILPAMVPVSCPADFQRINVPVTIAACRGDLCHPFEYGKYLAEQIPGCEFHEIPDKDTDAPRQNRRIGELIREILRLA